MSARGELPDVPANAIEQLLEECSITLRRLLVVGSACLAAVLLIGVLSLVGRAS